MIVGLYTFTEQSIQKPSLNVVVIEPVCEAKNIDL